VQYNQLIFLFILFSTPIIHAENNWSFCKPITDDAPEKPDFPTPEGESIELHSDKATVQEKSGISTFSGNVFVLRGGQILGTEVVNYERDEDELETDTSFTLWSDEFIVRGSGLRLYSNNQGRMNDADYWLLGRRGHGHAKTIIQKSKDIVNLENSTYTTCESDNVVWRLDTGETELNKATGIGKSRNVVIRFLDVPVFYTPYLSYPIDDKRKSGFLPPRIGSSNETGLDFSIPYYWNIHPSYDATLTPRMMSRRGMLLNTEFRYLTQATKGIIEAEYLPYDNVFEDDRGSLSFKNKGVFSPRWRTDVDFNYASDNEYFDDLGNSLSLSSITHLEQRGDAYYLGTGWGVRARVQQFQTLNDNHNLRPYKRLPQLFFKTYLPQRNRRLNLKAEAEIVRFERDVMNAPAGNRLNLKTNLNFPLKTSGTFFIPQFSLRNAYYDLENIDSENKQFSRNLYTASVDSGLFFERDVTIANTALVQTLEPRLYYRYTPYEDQSELPIFDTTQYDLSFAQLFRDNRFVGADRVDDGNQATVALTSRFLDERNGAEYVRASLGQIHYFKNRQVTLPNKFIETDSTSAIIAELAAEFSKNWHTSTTMRWNPNSEDTEYSVFRLRYNNDAKRIFNFTYRLRKDVIEQTDFSWYFPVTPQWRVLGRWNYSLLHESELEIAAGLEYETCCWAVQGIMRRYLNSLDGNRYSNSFFIQFEFKGLGKIGKKTDSFLTQNIPGYED